MGDQATGATPAAGATPADAGQEPPKTPETKPPATGDPELGDGGKAAIKAEREARASAEKAKSIAEEELAKLRDATSSEAEKAINTARREAETAERAKWQERFRAAEVRGALRGAGIVNDHFLALAVAAPEFRDLAVTDDGQVTGVTAAVESFKKNYPEAFPQGQPSAGSVARGVQTSSGDQPEVAPGYERMRSAYATAEPKRA